MSNIVKVVVQPILNKIVKIKTQEVQGPRGLQGLPGSSTTAILTLTVTSNGQTQFNIFTQPVGVHYLSINGAEYFFENNHYDIQNISSNWRLIWLYTASNSGFDLSTSDVIKFFKF